MVALSSLSTKELLEHNHVTEGDGDIEEVVLDALEELVSSVAQAEQQPQSTFLTGLDIESDIPAEPEDDPTEQVSRLRRALLERDHEIEMLRITVIDKDTQIKLLKKQLRKLEGALSEKNGGKLPPKTPHPPEAPRPEGKGRRHYEEANFTFAPQISPRASRSVERPGEGPYGARLYQAELEYQQKKQEKLNHLREERMQKLMEACSFLPKISKASQAFVARWQADGDEEGGEQAANGHETDPEKAYHAAVSAGATSSRSEPGAARGGADEHAPQPPPRRGGSTTPTPTPRQSVARATRFKAKDRRSYCERLYYDELERMRAKEEEAERQRRPPHPFKPSIKAYVPPDEHRALPPDPPGSDPEDRFYGMHKGLYGGRKAQAMHAEQARRQQQPQDEGTPRRPPPGAPYAQNSPGVSPGTKRHHHPARPAHAAPAAEQQAAPPAAPVTA